MHWYDWTATAALDALVAGAIVWLFTRLWTRRTWSGWLWAVPVAAVAACVYFTLCSDFDAAARSSPGRIDSQHHERRAHGFGSDWADGRGADERPVYVNSGRPLRANSGYSQVAW